MRDIIYLLLIYVLSIYLAGCSLFSIWTLYLPAAEHLISYVTQIFTVYLYNRFHLLIIPHFFKPSLPVSPFRWLPFPSLCFLVFILISINLPSFSSRSSSSPSHLSVNSTSPECISRVRFLLGGRHGDFKFLPPTGYAPCYEALLPKEKMRVEPVKEYKRDLEEVRDLLGTTQFLSQASFIPVPVITGQVRDETRTMFSSRTSCVQTGATTARTDYYKCIIIDKIDYYKPLYYILGKRRQYK